MIIKNETFLLIVFRLFMLIVWKCSLDTLKWICVCIMLFLNCVLFCNRGCLHWNVLVNFMQYYYFHGSCMCKPLGFTNAVQKRQFVIVIIFVIISIIIVVVVVITVIFKNYLIATMMSISINNFACVHACVRACARARVCVCVCVCVCMCVCGCFLFFVFGS